MENDWKQTRLWNHLKDTAAAQTLYQCMDQIQTVLQSSGTMPLDFTLHDAGHSFRVAERAANLLEDDIFVRLSVSDAAQLLLAAYLHDIGMSPSRDLSDRHRAYILNGDNAVLSTAERNDLQRWLDERWGGLVPPISANDVGSNGISKAEEIHAYYCRHKHNDWSERWIRENLVDVRAPLYHGWIDDLVTLCRSHHESLHDLRADRFDLRVVGSNGEVLNLRYLAALLRLADVMEFDPERTPEVILRHRDIAPKSKIYWRKDHSISFTVAKDEHTLYFAARTPDAAVHRAVLETADAVNSELATCATLEHEGLFQKGTAARAEKDRYVWRWPSQLRIDVREKDDSFVYIDGGFRPDKVKILELLSGTRLYGSHWAAIRELLQNAADAVREQIARERLVKDEPTDPKWSLVLGENHGIRISVETDGTSHFLTCADDGVGMDRSTIENHLLVSGSRTRGDLVALERDSKNSGFSVGRTGQFGIGLLSYFMVADSISISTRRSSEAGDIDGSGWRFSIEGLNSFGELRAESRGSTGTTVRLKLKKGIVGDPAKFVSELIEYIESAFRYSPCPIVVIDQLSSAKVVYGLGWTSNATDWKKRVGPTSPAGMGLVNRDSNELVPFVEAERARKQQVEWQRVTSDSAATLALFGPKEAAILEVAGQARGWVAYQDLVGGASLAYMEIKDGAIVPIMSRLDMVYLSGGSNIAWRGFSVGNRLRGNRRVNTIIEINSTENGEISVDRNVLKSSFDFEGYSRGVQRALLKDFLDSHADSDFSILNCFVARQNGFANPAVQCGWKSVWAQPHPDGKRWKSISFPCADLLTPKYSESTLPGAALLPGQRYSVLSHLAAGQYDLVKISDVLHTGTIAFAMLDGFYIPALTWENEDELRGVGARPFASRFPESWGSIALIDTPERRIFNAKNEVVAAESAIDLSPPSRLDSVEAVAERCKTQQNKSSCREFLFTNLGRGRRFWSTFRDNFPNEYVNLIRGAELPGGEIRIWHFDGSYSENHTVLLNEDGAFVKEHASQFGAELRFADGHSVPFKERVLDLVD